MSPAGAFPSETGRGVVSNSPLLPLSFINKTSSGEAVTRTPRLSPPPLPPGGRHVPGRPPAPGLRSGPGGRSTTRAREAGSGANRPTRSPSGARRRRGRTRRRPPFLPSGGGGGRGVVPFNPELPEPTRIC